MSFNHKFSYTALPTPKEVCACGRAHLLRMKAHTAPHSRAQTGGENSPSHPLNQRQTISQPLLLPEGLTSPSRVWTEAKESYPPPWRDSTAHTPKNRSSRPAPHRSASPGLQSAAPRAAHRLAPAHSRPQPLRIQRAARALHHGAAGCSAAARLFPSNLPLARGRSCRAGPPRWAPRAATAARATNVPAYPWRKAGLEGRTGPGRLRHRTVCSRSPGPLGAWWSLSVELFSRMLAKQVWTLRKRLCFVRPFRENTVYLTLLTLFLRVRS